jgi:uncharacterized membrane protein
MQKSPEELSKSLFGRLYHELTQKEQNVLGHIARKEAISRPVHKVEDDDFTLGQRIADQVAAFGGSWTFILIFVAILVAWIVLNSVVLIRYNSSFDPYPYILLNLFLSMTAALQAPVIMMSQNRQAAKDRAMSEHGYEVNLKAELEIMALHHKLDVLREEQWVELLRIQQEQIEMLKTLVESRSAYKG